MEREPDTVVAALARRVAQAARQLDAALAPLAPPSERHEAVALVLLRALVLETARARGLWTARARTRRHSSAWAAALGRSAELWSEPAAAGGRAHRARLFAPQLHGWLRRARVAEATAEQVFSRLGEVEIDGSTRPVPWEQLPVEALGELWQAATDALAERPRKRTGSFQTPRALVQAVLDAALGGSPHAATSVCDPAVGAGAFLLEALRRLGGGAAPRARALGRAARHLYGADSSALAIALCEASLWLEIGDPALPIGGVAPGLHVGDSLFDVPWRQIAPDGFDAVIGNPPWLAFAGRATQPLAPARRALLRERFGAFRGYPTLHGPFVELAARLAPRGVVALLVPSPLADLDGYRATRLALTRTHAPREPLVEFGQDAFPGVTQPCIALVADPAPGAVANERPWRLAERTHMAASATRVEPPQVLSRIAARPPWPAELFGEMGFQSAGDVARRLIVRAGRPRRPHLYPLLEGKDVRRFHVGAPRLFLDPDPEALRRAGCRLRPRDDYRRVAFVVRQTAKLPTAALHSGLPFRNSLLAGFDHPELPAELLVGLLNSSLYRALHLAARRDARQAAFPQVKIAHLRALPRPPHDAAAWSRIRSITRAATLRGETPSSTRELDAIVASLFGLDADEALAVERFLAGG